MSNQIRESFVVRASTAAEVMALEGAARVLGLIARLAARRLAKRAGVEEQARVTDDTTGRYDDPQFRNRA